MEDKKQFLKYFGLALLVLGGLSILGNLQERVAKKNGSNEETNEKNFFEINTFMGGTKKEYKGSNFKGGIINNVMGGSEIDLRDSEIENNATVDVFLLMGGAKLKVPKDWNVVLETTNIMGDSKNIFENEETNLNNSSKTLNIKGTVIMGGLEVKRY